MASLVYPSAATPTLAMAAAAAVDGDTIFIATNLVTENEIAIAGGVDVRAMAGWTPRLELRGAKTHVFHLAGDNEISGLAFINRSSDANARALNMDDGTGVSSLITVERCQFYGFPFIVAEAANIISGTMRRVRFIRGSGAGPLVRGKELVLTHASFDGCQHDKLVLTDGALSGGAALHCTFRRCGTDEGVRAGQIRNCVAMQSRASSYYFRALANGGLTHCLVDSDSTSQADGTYTTLAGVFELAAPPGTASNNIVAPFLPRSATDARPTQDSPAIHSGFDLDNGELDLDGLEVSATPTRGAWEMVTLSGAVATLRTIAVDVSHLPGDGLDLEDADNWWVSPAGVGAKVAVVSATLDGTTVTLTLHPHLSPGETYTVTLGAASATAAVATDTDACDEAPPYKHIALLMNAIGMSFSDFAGEWETRLARPMAPGDKVIFVESTHKFRPAGEVWVEKNRVAYTHKTDGAFHGLTYHPLLSIVPEGARVVRNDKAWVGDAG